MQSKTALRLIQEWATAHRQELEANWGRVKTGQPLERIAPLDWGATMGFLPSVTRAEYRGEYKIHLHFHDGVEKTVDFAQWLEGPIFEPLKDTGYFQRFFLDGGTVSWPNGADIAPETLYEQVESSEAA